MSEQENEIKQLKVLVENLTVEISKLKDVNTKLDISVDNLSQKVDALLEN